jgi:small subunit ribosomal protein S27Ae
MVERKGANKGDFGVHRFYSIDGDKVTRNRRDCPRCGKGAFMAQHRDRYTCGKCGFTEFSRQRAVGK